MLKIFEANHGRVITLFDDRRCVAVARKIPQHGWQVKGYALGWIDKGDKKNAFGTSNPDLLALKNVSQVRQLFNSIIST